MLCLLLFWEFAKIGLVCVGGGYASMPLIQAAVVDDYHWLTLSEFIDIFTISQMTPGPVSINTATYVGYAVAGLPGAVVATIALCLPSFLMMYFVVRFLMKNKENRYVRYVLSGLRPVLGGLILAAAMLLMNRENFCDFGWPDRNLSVLIFVASFVALYCFKVNPMWLIVASGVVGALIM